MDNLKCNLSLITTNFRTERTNQRTNTHPLKLNLNNKTILKRRYNDNKNASLPQFELQL